MNTKKLEEMIKAQYGSIRKMCLEHDLKYTTVMTNMETDEKLSHMKVGTFITIAHALGLTADELLSKIEY